MRALDPDFEAHLKSGATTLCHCWAVTRRDGVVLGFTDHDRTIFFDGVSFEPETGADGAAMAASADLAVDNTEIEGALHFRQVVEFDEHVELNITGRIVELFELVVIERGDDEEDGIGTRDAGFVDLTFVNGEVFSQKRNGRKAGDVHEVGKVSLEVFFVGENGHAAGSSVDVALGLADGIEIRIDDAGGRGGFFDFGNDTKLVGAAIEG